MIIAVDFDGTIVEHKYPKIGKPIPFAIETLLELQKQRHLLILWTVREGSLLQEAIDYCASNGLYFYAHNANFPDEERANAPRKLKADIFIDDRNVEGLPDWGLVYQLVQARAHGKDLGSVSAIGQSGQEKSRKEKKSGWKLW